MSSEHLFALEHLQREPISQRTTSVYKMFQADLGSSLIIRPLLPSTIRQHHRMPMPSLRRESVKPTVQTPTHISLMVIGNEHKIGLNRPNQTTQARVLTNVTTERSHSAVPNLPPLVSTAAVKTDKIRVTARAPLRQPAADLPQPVARRIIPVLRSHVEKPETRRVIPVPRSRVEKPVRAEKQSPVRQILKNTVRTENKSPVRQIQKKPARAERQSPVRQVHKNSGCKKKEPCKDKPKMPVRLLAVADFPPVSESVRALLMSNLAAQQRLARQRPPVTTVPRRAGGWSNSAPGEKMLVCPT